MFKAIGRFFVKGGYSLARVRYPQVFVQADLDVRYDVFDQPITPRESLELAQFAHAATVAAQDWSAQC